MNLNEEILRIKQVMKLNESEDNKSEDYDFIFSLFDDFTSGANIYYKPENESIWMILPEEKKWVFEFDANGTLWYNYHFFNGIFKYLSLDVIDNQHYITKWVEDTLKRGVKHTEFSHHNFTRRVEDTLKRGVKHTKGEKSQLGAAVEDTLKRGVKHTKGEKSQLGAAVEDTLKRGVKHTIGSKAEVYIDVKDTLKRGKKLNNDDEPK